MPENGPREWSPHWNYLAIHVNAGHTPSGNPKRGWYVVDHRTGDAIDFVEEGYEGRGALKRAYPNTAESGTLEITGREYRSLVRFAKEQAEKHKRGEI